MGELSNLPIGAEPNTDAYEEALVDLLAGGPDEGDERGAGLRSAHHGARRGGACVNCGEATAGPRRLYCSELCRQEAKAVRYGRAVHRDGRIARPDVEEALKIKLGSVVGGGYPEDERALSGEQRAAVFERDGWRCRRCGESATEIDHIGDVEGDINQEENLQALCAACHRDKTLESFRPATDEERRKLEQLWERIQAPRPLRPCDDDERWAHDWRGLFERPESRDEA